MVDSKAWNWDLVKGEMWEQPADEIYPIAFRWQKKKRGRVLDLGSGIGRHSILLAEMGFEVDAFELSVEAVRKLETKCKENHLGIAVKQGDMHSLPYKSNTFDYVLSYHVMYHTNRRGIEKVVSEIERVLKPAGEIFVTFNSKQSPQFHNKAYEKIEENTIIKNKGIEAGMPHYYVDENEMKRLLNGFNIIHFYHKEEIGDNWRGCHYFVLATR